MNKNLRKRKEEVIDFVRSDYGQSTTHYLPKSFINALDNLEEEALEQGIDLYDKFRLESSTGDFTVDFFLKYGV